MTNLLYKKTLILILCSLFLLSGCTSKPGNAAENKAASTPNASSPSSNAENKSQPAVEKYYFPYTGEEAAKELSSKPAYMSIIENSPEARPQSGFTEADIVYEAMAEGGITRCLAIYQKEDSPKIGPVRSMRTYFIDLAYEYNLPFAHCGGSHDALDRIKAENSMSMNEMLNGNYYWRDKTIKIQEHSLYTSSENLKKLAAYKGYAKEPVPSLTFDKSYWDNINSSKANVITVKFNGSYTTAYNLKDGLYYKSMNGKPSNNKEDNKPVAVKNVVIQNVNYRTRPNEPYLDADLVGQGDGYIVSSGKAIRITWSKANLKSPTVFKDEKGNIVPLNPGKTWWHLLDQNAKLTITE